MRNLWIVALMASACTDDTTDDQPLPATGDTASREAFDPSAGMNRGSAGLEGLVQDEAGNPVTDLSVQFCHGAGTCFTPESWENGTFTYTTLKAGTGSMKLVPPAGSDLATVALPITVADDATFTFDVTMLSKQHTVALPESTTEIEVAPGVFMTLGADTVTPKGLGSPATEFSWTDASAAMPHIEGVEAEEVLGLFYVQPYHYVAYADIRMQDVWGVSDGEAMLYQFDSDDGAWHLVGTATKRTGELIFDGRVTELSSLLLVR